MDQRRDDQRLWFTVSETYKSLEKEAPEGFAARVEVYLIDGTIVIPVVVTRMLPWVYFEWRENEDDPSTHRVVCTRPEKIVRIEIRYVRKEKAPPGFRVEEQQEPVASQEGP